MKDASNTAMQQEAQHSPAPWELHHSSLHHTYTVEHNPNLTQSPERVIARIHAIDAEQEANARRIVAAVNFMEGTDTQVIEEALAQGYTYEHCIDALQHEEDKDAADAKRQRDALLEACKRALVTLDAVVEEAEEHGCISDELVEEIRESVRETVDHALVKALGAGSSEHPYNS